MANELTLRASLSFAGDQNTITKAFGPTTLDVAGDNPNSSVQDVGITEEALAMGDAGVGGYLWAKNLDDTNFVEIRGGTGEADLVKLLPGDVCMFRLTVAPWVIADTGACRLEYCVIPL